MRAAALASRAAEVASRRTYQPWSADDKAAALQLAQQVQVAKHAAARAAMDAHRQDVQALHSMSQQQRDARAHQEWEVHTGRRGTNGVCGLCCTGPCCYVCPVGGVRCCCQCCQFADQWLQWLLATTRLTEFSLAAAAACAVATSLTHSALGPLPPRRQRRCSRQQR